MMTSTDTCLSTSEIDELARRFDRVDLVQALILVGSYARNQAGPYSDVDLVRFVRCGTKMTDDGTHLHEKGFLINISSYDAEQYDRWFTEPFEAIQWIIPLRAARSLIERESFFSNDLQKRAINFRWDETLKNRAKLEAGRRMVGWCEEAHKGLEGLRRSNDVGRLLQAVHGLSWGLSEVLQLHYGILLSGDNKAFIETEQFLVEHRQLIECRRLVFGVDGPSTLHQRVVAGLTLFLLITEEISSTWSNEHRQIVERTAEHIRKYLQQTDGNH